jgi:endonuclease III
MTKKKVAEIFARWQKANPHPTTELIYHSHFQLLAAVILSAQSTDKAVNQVTAQLFQVAPDAQTMSQMDLSELMTFLKRLGLYQQKAKALLGMSQQLVAQFDGEVPINRDDLEALPGVGRKTANVVLNTAFKIPVIAVDTHILRVAQRLGFSKGKTPRKVEDDLMKIIPKAYLLDAHHWMILHGRYICQARKPKCSECMIQDLCPFLKTSIR